MVFAVHGFVCLLLLALGLLFRSGKGAGLIAGYNTASPQEREKIDEKKLCYFVGRLMFLLSACWGLILLASILQLGWLFFLGFFLFLALTIGGVIFLNTKDRIKRS